MAAFSYNTLRRTSSDCPPNAESMYFCTSSP